MRLIKNDKIIIVIVSSIIIASMMLVILPTLTETDSKPNPSITWYFFPGCSTIPEDYSLCLNTLECGYGTFARSVKGQGIVDRDEIWKWREGLVTINFTKCPPNAREYYSSNPQP